MSREILEPSVQKMIHKRRYRVNAVHDNFASFKSNGRKRGRMDIAGYQEPDLYGEDEDDEENAADENIETTVIGDFKLFLHVPQVFYGGLIGTKGGTKRRIEEQTNCSIFIPRQYDRSSDVVITGKERSHVCAALRQVRRILDSLRRKVLPTHFLGVALNSGVVLQRFKDLKASILAANLPGINEALFISEMKIHITLGMLVLIDENERKQALAELEACRPLLMAFENPFDIKVKGLEIMNDDPSAVRVLYGRPESPDLQKFADQCLAHFQKTLLCAKDKTERKSIKLHMTVMNSRYAKGKVVCDDTFDAREILTRFGDYDFGSIKCRAIHLCVLKSFGEDNFYKISGSLKF
ncbi:hypothetical protein KR018_010511 [Drosophila ironensis]|nr:hypothetical protein KR018_010511 [Drosophila ironensis]